MPFQRRFLALAMLAAFSLPVFGGEPEGGANDPSESPSPDGAFAFRSTTGSETEAKAYELIDRQSGKVLARVAESEIDPGPSARFFMQVMWRPNSKAFALTATLWKRASYVAVYLRDGATFREVNLPDLEAEIPEKVKGGESYPHFVALDSQSATRWQKDGSLVVEIETILDGNGSSITANRTVVLGFDRSAEAKVLKSTIKFSTEKE